MAKYKAKTIENNNSVEDFIKTLTGEQRQKDALAIVQIMKEQSGFPAKMWGPAIIGFGSYHYVYESGHQGDAPMLGFSPRKTEFALYFGFEPGKKEEFLKHLGKHKASKACIYIKTLADVDVEILKKMSAHTVAFVKANYPGNIRC